MKTQTYLVTVLLVLIAALAVAACAPVTAPPAGSAVQPTTAAAQPTTAPAAGSATAAATTAASGQAVELTYAVWDQAFVDAMKSTIDSFNTAHQGKIHVTPQVLGAYADYWTKMKVMFAGDNTPDVIWMGGDVLAGFAKQGVLTDLTPLVQQDNVDLTQLSDAMVKLYQYKGKQYGIPINIDTIGLYYNKSMFDAAKVPYPDATWDWNKLREVALKFSDPAKRVYGVAITNDEQKDWANMLWSNGGDVLSPDWTKCTINDPKGVQTFQFIQDLIWKDKAATPPGSVPGVEFSKNFLTYYNSQHAAMKLDGVWRMKPDLDIKDFDWDVAPFPVAPGGKQQIYAFGVGNSIPAKSPHPKEAWEFVKWMQSDEAQVGLAKSGFWIPIRKGAATEWLNGWKAKNKNAQVFIDAIAAGRVYPYPTFYSEMTDKLYAHLDNIYLNKGQVQDELNAACKEIDALIAANP